MKKIAIAVEDDMGLKGEVSHHFGRCPCYVVAETKKGKVLKSTIERNPHFNNHQPGQMPEFIHSLGVDVILAGGMGPKAVNMFMDFGIEVATGAVGNVGKVLDAYLRGEVKGIVSCSHDHPESCGSHNSKGCT
jgi:predicted Fe-Mo cluster-binding NifX family protein